jgi:RNA polymerase sigma factor (sigma-70 family)
MDASPLRLCECLRAPAGDSPDTIAARKEQRGILRHAFTSLNDKRARVVRMRFEDGMTFQQIGNVLGISETAAFAMHGRALDELRGVLARQGIRSLGEIL